MRVEAEPCISTGRQLAKACGDWGGERPTEVRAFVVLDETKSLVEELPCIGVLLELENDRFRERGRMATWFNPRFVYIGRSDRGLDLRALYFKGARLKDAPARA